MTLKIISSLHAWIAGTRNLSEDRSAWLCDPLAHPAIRAMSEREIADLPLAGNRRPPCCFG